MLYPALGTLTAVWLLINPLIDLESGQRSVLAVAVGAASLVLAPLGLWYRPARGIIAALGAILAFVNFVDPSSVGSMANFAASGFALIATGMALQPASGVHAASATEEVTARYTAKEKPSSVPATA